MKWFKNLPIRKKLLTSFLITACVSLIAGCVGIVGMLTLNKNENTLYREGVELLTGISGMYAVIVEQRLELRGVIINIDDIEVANKAIANLHSREEEFDELYSTYLEASSGMDAKENELMKKAMGIYNGQYKVLKEQMVTAYESGDKETARIALDQIAEVSEQATEALYGMVVYGGERAADICERDGRTTFKLIGITLAVTLLQAAVSIALGFFNAKVIATPLLKMKDVLEQVSNKGNIDVAEETKKDLDGEALVKDEIGQSIAAFVNTMHYLERIDKVLELVADGDLTADFAILSEQDMVGQSIRKMLDSLNNMFDELRSASSQMAVGSDQVSQAAQNLASGSTEQAASVEEFSAALTNLEEKTKNNAENATLAREANDKAGTQLTDSGRYMNDLLEAMKSIDESSSSITKVIKVIEDIAFQTNILALNAAVEAARAGQHGKGFAVVADEVRNLASKSASAAKETAALIEGSSERVKEGNQIVSRTNESLDRVMEYAQELARRVGEVDTASAEQTHEIFEIRQGVDQISDVVQANSATAEQSAAAAQEMSAQADMLDQLVRKFKLRQGDTHNTLLTGKLDVPRYGKQPEENAFALSSRKY